MVLGDLTDQTLDLRGAHQGLRGDHARVAVGGSSAVCASVGGGVGCSVGTSVFLILFFAALLVAVVAYGCVCERERAKI